MFKDKTTGVVLAQFSWYRSFQYIVATPVTTPKKVTHEKVKSMVNKAKIFVSEHSIPFSSILFTETTQKPGVLCVKPWLLRILDSQKIMRIK